MTTKQEKTAKEIIKECTEHVHSSRLWRNGHQITFNKIKEELEKISYFDSQSGFTVELYASLLIEVRNKQRIDSMACQSATLKSMLRLAVCAALAQDIYENGLTSAMLLEG